jgi:divalent metal cation (Fe/Co/Zn/Cd) transporter
LFALAAFVAVTTITSLLGYNEPKPTFLGIAILVAAAVVMPWLAKEKQRLSGATSSGALRADAAQSALCAYLSLIALTGLAINALMVTWPQVKTALSRLVTLLKSQIKAYFDRPRIPRVSVLSFRRGPVRTFTSRRRARRDLR